MINNTLTFVILLIQVIAIIIIIMSFVFYKNKFLINLLPKLPILTGLLTSTGIILTYLSFSNTYLKNISDATIASNKSGFDDVFSMLNENYVLCPKFVDSLNFDFVKKTDIDSNYNSENSMAIRYMSNVIFQAIENYTQTAVLTNTSDASWAATFMAFLSSKQLQEQWLLFQYNFGLKTRTLINFLIEKNNSIKFKNSDEVIKFSDNLVKSKEFNDILHIVDDTNITLVT